MKPAHTSAFPRRPLLACACACVTSLASLMGLIILLAAPSTALAQSYPDRPIRVIVPYPPGGPTDVLARIVSARLGERLGQSLVIDNKPGASGMIGADIVAKARPDGYTLLVNASIHVINPSLYDKTPHDAIADFAPVSNLADVPLVLAVNTNLPVNSVQELAEYARTASTPLAFSSAGNGSAQHLSGEAFKIAAQVDMLHVPYKGSAPALTDLIGGQVQLMFDSMPSSMPHLKAGSIRPLAVTTSKRTPALPDVPTIAESGFPGFSISTWYGVWAPAGTPPAIVEQLSREISAVVNQPEVREQLAGLGAQAVGNTPAEFAAFALSERAKWADIVQKAGAKLN